MGRIGRQKSRKSLVFDGETLSPEQVHALAYGPESLVALSPAALKRVRASHAIVKAQVRQKVVYGVTTGFGPMASHIIARDKLDELQLNLVRSHSVGAGPPLPAEFVLAAMASRLNTFLKGNSGVSEGLIRHLAGFIEHRIAPIVPEHGAVGTSGDLVQLAHIALGLIGEGEVFYRGKRRRAPAVLRKLGIAPLVLHPKEGLSLINGTSMMTGIAALLVVWAERIVGLSIRAGALALELVNGLTDAIAAELHAVRPHVGQGQVARHLRELLADSKLLTHRHDVQARVNIIDDTYVTPEQIQEIYSLRCIPQILGPVVDIVRKFRGDVTVELNSVTDNPVIDIASEVFLHGGNFHGDYIAAAVDQMKIGIVKLTILAERQINFFLNRNVNRSFPPFLNLNQPGLTLALQGVNFVATSTTAHSQSLAYPHSLHSISTNGDNQDVVSMGTDAALIGWKVIENAFTVLAIELIALAQAVDVLDVGARLAPPSRALYEKVRAVVPAITKDRSFSGELNQLIDTIRADASLAIS
jgi:histidine ammonia-lyase